MNEEDTADLELLRLANEKGKFGIQLDAAIGDRLQAALERGMDHQWFTLVDLSSKLETAPGRMMRVFRLTPEGHHRLALLAGAAYSLRRQG